MGDGYINDAVIDSHEAGPGKLFIAIRGENLDGHDYIKEALENGAEAVVSEKAPQDVGVDLEELGKQNKTFLLTSSTKRALKRIASFNRERSGIPVIAVTGSSGKTTTKDLIASVLSQRFKVHKTDGNLNNAYGVPRTLIGIEEDDEIAVVEMGMNHLGEIDQSIRLVRPQIALITNIGTAHMENLHSRENILQAKKEILTTLEDRDTAILNGDDDLLKKIEPRPFKIMRYGIHSVGLNLKAENCYSGEDGIAFNIGRERYRLKFPGEHNIYNVLAAISVAKMYGLEYEEIQRGLDQFYPSDHRLNIFEKDGVHYIDDSYNANPDSMRAALESLSAMASKGKRTIAVLGDMEELGELSLQGHLETGRAAARNADILIGIGEKAINIMRGALQVRAGMQGKYFKSKDEATEYLRSFLGPDDIVLFKASNAMGFKDILKDLTNE